jgi:hypothetical protein
MRVYYFTTAEHALSNIRLRRIKYARINEINDPFDMGAFAAHDREVRRVFNAWKDTMHDLHGLICLSRDRTNPVQWAHYSDRHRGICLGFEAPRKRLMRVRYVTERPLPNVRVLTGSGRAAQIEMRKQLTIKFKDWAYERECRVFGNLDEADPDTGLHFLNFNRHLVLKSVFVGHRCAVTRAEIDDALGALTKSVERYKVRLAFKTFRVAIQQNPALWK